MTDVMAAVPALLRQAADEVVLPVFGMGDARPEEKSPGEWVTTADRAAEAFLAPRLAALVPGSVVVGEEAASADPAVLDRLAAAGDVWLLDPLDGTANFAAGAPPFALMAALLRDGEAVASWILDPLSGRLAAAERRAGAWLDGGRVSVGLHASELSAMRGAVLRRFLPDGFLGHVDLVEAQFAGLIGGSRCAGHDYPSVVSRELEFALFWRTLPWDHVPGVLFVSEAGGVAARLDGSPYVAVDHARSGLLVAHNPDVWSLVRDALVPQRYRVSPR